jgi:hypothetical protein
MLNFKKKVFRYDAILSRGLSTIESYLVGNTPFQLDSSETEIFINYLKRTFSDEYIKNNIKYIQGTRLLRLWPSDHFGVITKFIKK